MDDNKNVLSAGVDAFTCTSRSSIAADLMREAGHDAIELNKRRGDVSHEVNYHGYKGIRCGSAMYAVNDSGQALIEVKGSETMRTARKLYGAQINVTRIDLQVTFRTRKDRPTLAVETADNMIEKRKEMVGKNWAKPSMYLGFGEGDTLYLGSRESGKFARIYNKWLQSKDKLYKHCWRAEIEYKKDDAPIIWCHGSKEDFNPIWVQSVLTTYFIGQGAELPIRQLAEVYIPGAGRNETDMERKLAWIKQSVYPTMQVLCDNGYREPLMQMMLDLE